jgi:hypothetical protein
MACRNCQRSFLPELFPHSIFNATSGNAFKWIRCSTISPRYRQHIFPFRYTISPFLSSRQSLLNQALISFLSCSLSLLSRQPLLNQALISFLSCSLCSSSSTNRDHVREYPSLPWSPIITGPMNCSPGMPITKRLSVLLLQALHPCCSPAARRRIRGLRFHWSVRASSLIIWDEVPM